MDKQTFRDNLGRATGEIQIYDDGKQQLRDVQGRPLGSYDPRSNLRRDIVGRPLGQGNLLPALIKLRTIPNPFTPNTFRTIATTTRALAHSF